MCLYSPTTPQEWFSQKQCLEELPKKPQGFLMMDQYVNKDHSDWDRFLPFLVFTYNTSEQETTGYSPYFLLHRYEPQLGIELQMNTLKEVKNHFTFENIIYANRAREIAKERTTLSQQKSKTRFDRHRLPSSYKVGDLVWIRRFARQVGKADKLLHSYLGPFRFIAQTASNDYLVEDSSGVTDVVNVERFKPYFTRDNDLSLPENSTQQTFVKSPTSPPPAASNDDNFYKDSDDEVKELYSRKHNLSNLMTSLPLGGQRGFEESPRGCNNVYPLLFM